MCSLHQERDKIEVIVAKRTIDDVLNDVSTGSSYDGKVFVTEIAESYDIWTGDAAL